MTDADLAATQKNEELWQQRLQQSQHTRQRLAAQPVDKVLVRSARSQCLAQATGPAWLAVGDAAFSFDPLSSAGIHKSLLWASKAVPTVQQYLPGADEVLVSYQQQAQAAFDNYLKTRAHYYQKESRWPDSLFWQRRQTAA